MSRIKNAVENETRASAPVMVSRSRASHDGTEIAALGMTANVSSSIAGTAGDDILIGQNGGDELIGKRGDDQLYGQRGDDVLRGGQGDDLLIGGPGRDSLHGGAGNDRLDGGSGRDRMIGNGGDDIYILDSSLDEIVEEQNGGYDLIGTYITTSMPLWVEEIIALEDAPTDILGNDLGNLIVGNSNSNVLAGGKGSDTIIARGGNDTLRGDAGADILVGSGGHDDLRGGAGGDILEGKSGNDVLNGGSGHDVLVGGVGNNTLRGGGGQDYFVVEFPGDQLDNIVDFRLGEEGDRILLADGVLEVRLTNEILDEFVQITGTSDSTAIAIDPDGGDSFVVVARLDNLLGLANSLVVAEDGGLMIVPAS